MLKVQDLHVAFGNIEVLKGISFSVDEGRIVTLIGANGAGKTTTLHSISGLVRPTQGTIEFLGEAISGQPPEQVVRKGIAHVPEGRKVFRNLSVYENLLMGGFCRRDKKAVNSDIERAFAMFPRLKERRRQAAGTLSGGEQQMLAFARALVTHPRLLLLDEPSMGLAPQLVEEVAHIVTQIRDQGVTVLLVEQNAELALSIADYGYVLETGQITFSDDAPRMLHNEQIQRSYLGM